MTKKRKKYTAAALTAMTAVVVGATGVVAEQSMYSDVNDSHKYSEAIQELTTAGIVTGFEDGTFKPDATVTRGQAAKMIVGALNLDTKNVVDPKFSDITQSNHYYGAISALVSTGFISGYEDNTFRSSEKITHGQFATILTNVSAVYPIDTQMILKAANVSFNPTNELSRGELSSILATILAGATTPETPEASENFKLSVMHVNDTHARVENFPKLMTAVNDFRATSSESLLLHSGDAFSGTLYFSEFKGQADIQYFNALGFDAMTLGNHEFDLGSSPEGHKALADFVKAAKFPILTANVDFTKDPIFTGLFTDLNSSDPENGKIYSGMVKEINGEKVGIFGLTTEETESVASPGKVTFENYIKEAEKAVKAFEGMGINKIIALTHIGFDDSAEIDNDQILAKSVPGIDIIVGGHSHTKLEKPFIVDTNTVGEKKDSTIIVQASEQAQFLGTLDVEFDEQGVVVGHNGQLIDVAKLAADPKGTEMLAQYKEKVDVIASKEIGVTLKEPLLNPRLKTTGDTASVRNSETALGNIITDGMLAKAKSFTGKNVVMALQNGGGIRSDIPAGNVTLGQAITVLPFTNTLAVMDITGADLLEAFEFSVRNAPKENGGFLHIAGAQLVFDSSKEVGSRVVSLKYYDEKTKAYVDIKADETYTVATNAFTARGGDDYEVFKKIYDAGKVQDLGLSDYENFVEQLTSLKEVKTTTEGRITDVAAPVTETK
ncbi:bifunctional metallophosphatase/5'-nucleotidase [Solibacillus sp. R5-41]|uniref:5'-nucleotidase C-terminal domain-containing protein n=1 Tax=Solibacillus sp. R5-41 TaxID=2048654 RepID=UPI000C125D53|nr:5'-nucleotidase C-terminal domain-containing protein [Solibacillus sp. R5-41]ATP40448.1 bifunctional metallophosphatase/5'-nucleotidase [Solibacillus sp. R5-41]